MEELLKSIQVLREKMMQLAIQKRSLRDPEVLQISNELDELVAEIMKLKFRVASE